MQHSDKVKIICLRVLKFALCFAIFVAINTCICKFLEPSPYASKEMWREYCQKNNADTVFIGSSVAEMIRSEIIDEYTGRNSVNMGTPSQYYATSIDLLNIAAMQKPVDTVVLLIGFDSLERDEDLKSTISVEKTYFDNAGFINKQLGFFRNNLAYSFEGRNINSSDSINKWIRWPVNSLVYFDKIREDQEKENYWKEVYKDQIIDPYHSECDEYDRASVPREKPVSREILNQAREIESIEISDKALIVLRQIGEYCASNGILFIVAVSPHNSAYSQGFDGEYEKLDAFTRSYVESVGGIYVNMDSNPSVREMMPDELFTDSEHVTSDGEIAASGVMSDILNLLTGKRN